MCLNSASGSQFLCYYLRDNTNTNRELYLLLNRYSDGTY